MTTKFGHCLAAPGARVPHERCTGRVGALACSCPCHNQDDPGGAA